MKHRIYLSDVFGKYLRRYPHLSGLTPDARTLAKACLYLQAPTDVTPAETLVLAEIANGRRIDNET